MKQNLGWIKNIEVLFKNHRLEIIRGNMESTQVQMVVNGTVEVSLVTTGLYPSYKCLVII